MRVLSVIETLGHGGAETVLVDLVSGLTEHEHRVVHFSGFNNERVHPWIETALERMSVPCLDTVWESLDTPESRRRLLGDFEPDVVFYHWWGHDSLRRWIAGSERVPASQRPFFALVLHRSGIAVKPGYDAYVLVTPSQRQQVTAIDSARVHVIPNAVDLARFPGSPMPRTARRPFVVGRLSNLRAGKIPADWVRTAASYGLDDTQFIIAGEGPLRPILKADAHSLGLQAIFSLPGYVPRERVPEMLATFDVYCYVTGTAVECHPLALLEACAAGLPIVAEARGGVPDIVVHESNGLLARSSDEVGEWLRRLQGDNVLRSRLAHGSREVASRNSLDHQLSAYRGFLTMVARARAA